MNNEAHKTNAARILDSLGIPYVLHMYDVDESDLSAVHVAQMLGAEPYSVFKTLPARTEKRDVCMFCIPGPAELDLKKAAKASGCKSIEMVPLKELFALTGYMRGGCSPVGAKKPYPVYLDELAFAFDRIFVSAGRRGMNFELAPDELARATEATITDLCR